jgi:hypothetical protein
MLQVGKAILFRWKRLQGQHYVNELQKIFCKYIIVWIKKLESAKPEDMSDDEYGFSEKNKKKLQKNLGMWKSTFWNR